MWLPGRRGSQVLGRRCSLVAGLAAGRWRVLAGRCSVVGALCSWSYPVSVFRVPDTGAAAVCERADPAVGRRHTPPLDLSACVSYSTYTVGLAAVRAAKNAHILLPPVL